MSNSAKGVFDPITYGAVERASLSALPARFGWLAVSALVAGIVVDLVGPPGQEMTWLFVTFLALGAMVEISINLVARRKLNREIVGPLFIATKIMASSQNTAALIALAMLVGDSVLTGTSAAQASILGMVLGAIGSACGQVPHLAVAANSEGKQKKHRALTESDLDMVAFHEAGHALSLAMIPESWREGARVNIGDSGSTYTYFPRNEAVWELGVMRRWEMLMLLAGPVATDKAYGTSMEGGASDMREWRYRAMSVLTADRTEGWVIDPSNDLEYEGNSRLLAALEQEQAAALDEFFEMNWDVYSNLAEHIRANNGIEPQPLNAFLEPVKMGPRVNAALGI